MQDNTRLTSFPEAPVKRPPKVRKQINIFRVLYLMGFIFSLSSALPIYINSSFLATIFSDRMVSFLYTAGAALTLVALVLIPRILGRYGNYKTSMVFALFSALLMVLLSFLREPFLVGIVFVLYSMLLSLIFFNFDIFLEHYTRDTETGNIRGFFLTTISAAIAVAPFISGMILTDGDYWKIYLLGASAMILFAIFLYSNFRNYEDSRYQRIPFFTTMGAVLSDKNLRGIFFSNLLLRFFFAWMIIYTPIYLHEHMGFEWSQIGVIFTVMLLPFILFELPAGKIADNKWGEKELLVTGFFITGISTAVLVFIPGPLFFVWMAGLFITRIGASLIEIMTESYFFKHVGGDDAHIIGFFRNNRPIAYIAAPLIASVVLTFLDFKYLFVVLGVIMLTGVHFAMTLKDTR